MHAESNVSTLKCEHFDVHTSVCLAIPLAVLAFSLCLSLCLTTMCASQQCKQHSAYNTNSTINAIQATTWLLWSVTCTLHQTFVQPLPCNCEIFLNIHNGAEPLVCLNKLNKHKCRKNTTSNNTNLRQTSTGCAANVQKPQLQSCSSPF